MATELDQVKRLGWSPYLGKTDTLVSVSLLGRYPIRVQDFWVPAVAAMETALIATGYENPCDYIGSYMKRYISGTTIWSFHSYGAAVDLDYGGDTDGDGDPTIDKNPHLHRPIQPEDFGVTIQLLEHQVRAIEKIRTNSDATVWRWLGWSIGDSMHFEPACTPDDIRSGIDPRSLPGYEEGDTTMAYLDAQDVLDQWDVEDLEHFQGLGWWEGAPGSAGNYYKNPEASPHPDDVKTLVTDVLAHAAVFASYEDQPPDVAELEQRVTAVEVDQEDLRSTLRSV